MERKIEKVLMEWKESANRLPLILYGARQVGKTYTVTKFAMENYQFFVRFNFEENISARQVFDGDLSPAAIVRALSLLSNTTIVEGETLIFFDEIQSCERALTSLKYFAEQAAGFHIIAAGSLLGVKIKRDNYSFPVGKVSFHTLFPLDFEEFLWALGKKDASAIIRECYLNNSECFIHNFLLDQFGLYLAIGGMPQVVERYLQNSDFKDVTQLKRNIIDSYIADMAKYSGPYETVKIIAAFQSIPSQLAKENRKFQYKLIKSGARSYQYEVAIDWLCASGVINRCVKVSAGNIPLNAFADVSSFKLYFGDVGLLVAQLGVAPEMLVMNSDKLNFIKGAIVENYVFNALMANGIRGFYWESEGKAEVDFVFNSSSDANGNADGGGVPVPIEVKAADNVRSRSLQQFVSKYSPPYSIRVSRKNFGFENGIKSVPLYSCFCVC